MTEWDYSRVAYIIFRGLDFIVVHSGDPYQQVSYAHTWYLFRSGSSMREALESLDLSLLPELTPDNQLKLL